MNKLGQHDEALACFQKALEIEPGRAVTYENMANTYENMGSNDEALRCYKAALRSTKYPFGAIKDQIKAQIKRLEDDIADKPR